MRPYSRIALIALAAFASCKGRSREDMLSRKWQEVSVENPQMEAAITKELAKLDALQDSDTAILHGVYRTSTADSARAFGKAAIAEQRKMQEDVIRGSWFNFEKDGKLQMHSPRGTDNVKWTLKDDRILVTKEGVPKPKEWKVTHLSDTALHIVAANSNVSYNVRFHPAN